MVYVALLIVVCITILLFYKYSIQPRTTIKRLEETLKKLGYKVYVQRFQFLGISFAQDNERSFELKGDSQYEQRTIFSQVDVVLGNSFNKLLVVLIDPDLTKEFLSAQKINIYPKYKMFIQGLSAISGEGLIFSEAQMWKNKRKILSKVFNFDLLKENIPKIAQISDKILDDFDIEKKTSENKFTYDVCKLGVNMFSEVMMKCFLGYGLQTNINGTNFSQFASNLTSDAGTLSMKPYFVFFGKLIYKYGITKQVNDIKRRVGLFREKTQEIIKIRIKQIEASGVQEKCMDIVQALVYEKTNNDGYFQYSIEQLIDEFATFLIAGTDTTTNLFNMMVYYVGKDQRIQERLKKQVNQVIKTNSNDEITLQNLKKLTYIDRIQSETLRYYGPANGNLLREAMVDDLLMDVPIPKGTLITNQPKGTHYCSKYFKDPEIFRPERWEHECDNINPYAFLGFSGGSRSCIGKQLSLLESKIALVKIIKRYDNIEVPKDLKFVNKLLYVPLPFETTFTKTQL